MLSKSHLLTSEMMRAQEYYATRGTRRNAFNNLRHEDRGFKAVNLWLVINAVEEERQYTDLELELLNQPGDAALTLVLLGAPHGQP